MNDSHVGIVLNNPRMYYPYVGIVLNNFWMHDSYLQIGVTGYRLYVFVYSLWLLGLRDKGLVSKIFSSTVSQR